jgi:hypothetical protein
MAIACGRRVQVFCMEESLGRSEQELGGRDKTG